MYKAKVLADSISPDGVRLVTMEVEYPHAIHKDIMTHRCFSRNFQSFRAFPPEKVIERIKADPFVPDAFRSRIKGMGEGVVINGQEEALEPWMAHIEQSIQTAERMMEMNLAKAQVNFVLQDLTSIRGIISATEWDNFWNLRLATDENDFPRARPEVYKIAKMMNEVFEKSVPQRIEYGEWAIPLTELHEALIYPNRIIEPRGPLDFIGWRDWDTLKKVSTARCARVSYLTHDGQRDLGKDIALHDNLMVDGHMCYDDKTEVMTLDGWKPWVDISGKEKFLTRQGDKLGFEMASATTHSAYKGEMVIVKTNAIDLCITPNHRLWGSIRTRKGWEDPALHQTSSLFERPMRMEAGPGWETKYLNALGQFVGFFCGDGYQKNAACRPTFHLKRNRKVAYLREVCYRLGWMLTERTGGTFSIDVPVKYRILISGCYDRNRKKQIPYDLLTEVEMQAGLLDGLQNSDGSEDKRGHLSFSNTSNTLLEQYTVLCSWLGGAASLGMFRNSTGVQHAQRRANRNLAPRVGWTKKDRKDQIGTLPYDGYVHCVTLPTGVLLVRRNGIPIWSGNSPFEHIATPIPITGKKYLPEVDPTSRKSTGNLVLGPDWRANFYGWRQYRFDISHH